MLFLQSHPGKHADRSNMISQRTQTSTILEPKLWNKLMHASGVNIPNMHFQITSYYPSPIIIPMISLDGGATVVDGIDTAIIMGLTDIVEQQLKHIASVNFTLVEPRLMLWLSKVSHHKVD